MRDCGRRLKTMRFWQVVRRLERGQYLTAGTVPSHALSLTVLLLSFAYRYAEFVQGRGLKEHMRMKTIGRVLPAVVVTAGIALASSQAVAATEAVRANESRPAAATANSYVKAFPRLLGGNGWQTTIVLMDLGSTPVSFQESFRGNNGTAMPFSVTPDSTGATLTTSGLQGTIVPNGTMSFTLQGTAASVQEAWSLVTFTGTQDQLGGYAVLHHTSGSASFDMTVPLSNLQDYSVRAHFDNTGGFQTQITLVNPASNLAAQVQLEYFNAQGQVTLVDSVTLNPGQQTTLSLPNTYPDLANQTGTVAILGNLNTLSVAALRYNPTTGAIASIPAMNYTTSIVVQ